MLVFFGLDHDLKWTFFFLGNVNKVSSQPMELPFFYYPSSVFVIVLEFIFYVNIPTALVIFTYTGVLLLENINSISLKLKNNKGQFVLSRLLSFRLFVTIMLFFFGFFNWNEYFIIIISGSILGPFILFLLPVKIIRFFHLWFTTRINFQN